MSQLLFNIELEILAIAVRKKKIKQKVLGFKRKKQNLFFAGDIYSLCRQLEGICKQIIRINT